MAATANLGDAVYTDAHARIVALVGGASLELSSRDPAEIDACARYLDPGTAIYVSMPPWQTYHGVVSLAARVARAGLRPVPHIAARRIASTAALEDCLARAVEQAGVDTALLIAGDAERPSGPFDSSLALLQTGLFERHGIVRIGVAGHPEGHPKIASATLEAALGAKAAVANRNGLRLHVVTQFCFEAPLVLAWSLRLKARGLPVHIGLAGPASLTRLLRFAALCGVGNSVRALRARPDAIARMLTEAGPEAMIRQLAQPSAAPVTGLHFYCFGGMLRTARWLRAMQQGRFELTADGGLRVGSDH